MLSAVRRSVFALGAAGAIALWLRMHGSDSNLTAPESGGWRELTGPDLK